MYEVANDSLEEIAGGYNNYLDEKSGMYHVVCKKCGKDVRVFKPTGCYACDSQICEECAKKAKKSDKK